MCPGYIEVITDINKYEITCLDLWATVKKYLSHRDSLLLIPCQEISSNLIGKKAGCDEYVEDQLNVASQNLAKYPCDDKDT